MNLNHAPAAPTPDSSVQVMVATHVPPAHSGIPGLLHLTPYTNLRGMLNVSHHTIPRPQMPRQDIYPSELAGKLLLNTD